MLALFVVLSMYSMIWCEIHEISDLPLISGVDIYECL